MMEVKSNITKYKIKDITEVVTKGTSPSTYGYSFEDNGINFFKVESLFKINKIKEKNISKISIECHNKLTRSKIKENDILFSIAGTLGRMSIIPKSYLPANTNQALAIIRLNKDQNVNYVYWALQSPIINKVINTIATTGAQPNLSLQQVGNLDIFLPLPTEQQKIAEILSTVDKQIEQTDQLIEKTKELKKGLMQQLLTKGIGHNEFKQSELGEVAINWKISTFKTYTRINQGLQIAIEERFKESGVNRHVYITNQFLKESGDRFFIENPQISVVCNEEDILMTRTGNTGIVVTNVSGVFHNNFFRVAYNKEELIKDFLVYYLRSEKIQKIIKKYAASTTIPDLKHSDFYKIIIVIPPLEEQQKIADILSSVDEDIEGYMQEKSKYEELKKGLMQQLLTGKTRVKVD